MSNPEADFEHGQDFGNWPGERAILERNPS